MLDPEQTWIDEFKKIPPAKTAIEGITNLADVIEKLTNKVEPNVPGGQGQPGIFQWNKATFIAQMMALVPTQAPDWIPKVANAWMAACSTGIITPATVTAPSLWAVSTKDVNTLPAVPATVPTVATGQAAIIGILSAVPAQVMADATKSPELYAKAFRAGVSAFVFTLIGIAGTPPSPVPTPVPAPAK